MQDLGSRIWDLGLKRPLVGREKCQDLGNNGESATTLVTLEKCQDMGNNGESATTSVTHPPRSQILRKKGEPNGLTWRYSHEEDRNSNWFG